MTDNRLWDLTFSVEVSARYHEWRRMFLERWVIFVRVVSAVGASLSLIGLSLDKDLVFGDWTVNSVWLVATASAAIAIVNIIDFVAGADSMARDHAQLYIRFKQVQERMARKQASWERHIAEWDADVQSIRRDEPPTYWALYMVSWNQAVSRRDPLHNKGARKISGWQRAMKNFIHFLPDGFPLQKPYGDGATLSQAA